MTLYDNPQYFDLTFADETLPEADFIEAACAKYGRASTKRLLEPGCGGGRLVVELARRGYQVTGFDLSLPALNFLQKQLDRKKLRAEIFAADLANFSVPQSFDAAYCTFNTFRHLLTEKDAADHLRLVAKALRPGGIYILGFHLLPLDVDESCIERWTASRGQTRVTVTLRVMAADRRARLEQMRLSMLVRHREATQRFRSEFQLRMYTASQFRSLLRKIPEFTLCDVFDFWYEIDRPLKLNDEITDTVFILRKE